MRRGETPDVEPGRPEPQPRSSPTPTRTPRAAAELGCEMGGGWRPPPEPSAEAVFIKGRLPRPVPVSFHKVPCRPPASGKAEAVLAVRGPSGLSGDPEEHYRALAASSATRGTAGSVGRGRSFQQPDPGHTPLPAAKRVPSEPLMQTHSGTAASAHPPILGFRGHGGSFAWEIRRLERLQELLRTAECACPPHTHTFTRAYMHVFKAHTYAHTCSPTCTCTLPH